MRIIFVAASLWGISCALNIGPPKAFSRFVAPPSTPPAHLWTPILFFVNGKSGGGQGRRLRSLLEYAVGKDQVSVLS